MMNWFSQILQNCHILKAKKDSFHQQNPPSIFEFWTFFLLQILEKKTLNKMPSNHAFSVRIQPTILRGPNRFVDIWVVSRGDA